MTQIVCRWCGNVVEYADHNDTVCYWTRQRDVYERGAANARRELAKAQHQLRAAILSDQPATMTTNKPEE